MNFQLSQTKIRGLTPIYLTYFCLSNTLYARSTPATPSLKIEISEEAAEGTYANLTTITHFHAEYVIGFANVKLGMVTN